MLALTFAVLCQLALGIPEFKFSCVFDCYLFQDKGSARGYLEFTCDPATESDCCSWNRCIAQASALYRGIICPSSASDDATHPEGFAQYKVGLAEEVALQYPRNRFHLGTYPSFSDSQYTLRTCPEGPASAFPLPSGYLTNSTCGCIGSGCSDGACLTSGSHALDTP